MAGVPNINIGPPKTKDPPGAGRGNYAIYDTPGNAIQITNFHEAAEHGDLVLLGKFAKKRPFNIEARDRFGRTALMWACDTGQMDAVEMLMRYGADTNAIEVQTGRSPIHLAARSGDEDIIKELVRCGCDIHKPDRFGLTPLYLALLQKGRDLGYGAPGLLVQLGAKYNESVQTVMTGLTPEESFAATGDVKEVHASITSSE